MLGNPAYEDTAQASNLSRKSGLGGALGKGILASMSGKDLGAAIDAARSGAPAASDAPAAAADGEGSSTAATTDGVEMTAAATPSPAVRVQALPMTDEADGQDEAVTVNASLADGVGNHDRVVDGVSQSPQEAEA